MKRTYEVVVDGEVVAEYTNREKAVTAAGAIILLSELREYQFNVEVRVVA